MVSPNTLRLQHKDEKGNELLKLSPRWAVDKKGRPMIGRPNFLKEKQRMNKKFNRGNTRGKRNTSGGE